MHSKRLVVAAFVLPLLYLYVAKLPPFFFLLLLTAGAVLAQSEFYSMYKTRKELSIIGVIVGVLILWSSFISSQLGQPACGLQAIIFMAGFMILSSTRLFMVKDPEASLKDLAPALTGLLYVPNLLAFQWHLRLKGHEWIILLYGCVWASDSLAYYFGKGFGKRKLYVEVSPNKTVEGAYGSVIGGILSAVLLGRLMLEMDVLKLVLIGASVGSVTIVGDLVESMFKRDAGVKDSGSLVPGHGGILDKVDGVLFASPVLYLLTLLL